MILTDTGPLVALANPDDPYREACLEASQTLGDEVMVTTWLCFTEAMHLLGRDGRYYLQDSLWEMRRTGRLQVHSNTDPEADRMDTLMKQYSNFPMDVADASLVAAAESLNLSRLFTIDPEFYSYRLLDGSFLEVVP